ncbi:MAG: CDP-diacylglycerol--serine O-phosphatidyltransferase [Prevotellaceae bacterium]|jgi:CDP-diacylglycerol--serine O-phosphatidyltransferase|nr:CDP-diacylglycerol--serine O-phosphatidyltransferase [Prevotellaceae bacterium]
MKKHIPNFITCLNLFSGCVGTCFAFQGETQWAFHCILLSGAFDFLDGFAARMLKTHSPTGKELDSLADAISFGLLPGAMVFYLLSQATHTPIPFIGFLIPVFSALRLAKFNIDDRQTTSFIGLPVPANAIFWGGLIHSHSPFLASQPWMTIGLTVVFSLLLVSALPMFSLKMKNLSWNDNKTQYSFLAVCALLLLLLRSDAFAPIITAYILFSIAIKLFGKKAANN